MIKHYATSSIVGIITMLAVCLACLLLPPGPADGAEPAKIGVLSFRPKPQTLAQWWPLASALKKAMPDRDFEISALTYPELNRAVAAGSLDFVLTNPAHFIQLKMGGKLSAPLATVAMSVNGKGVSAFGGVIITRADKSGIQLLEDIKGRTIAVPDNESLGGYLMQAYELSRAGVHLPRDARLLVTGMPHDKVVNAVLAGQADVGFLRSGVLEAVAREGKVEMNRLKILNRQQTNFPQILSTPLYPEWPFSSLTHIDENLARHVAAALFGMEEGGTVARSIGIHGFSVPADYTPVEELLRELRFPPFDTAPSFTLSDVWRKYRWQAVFTVSGALMIMLLGFRLFLLTRKLEIEKRLVQAQAEKIQESETYLRTVIETEPECVKQVDADGRVLYMNSAGLRMVEADSLEQVLGLKTVDMIADGYRDAFNALTREVFAGETGTLVFQINGLKGNTRWLETHAVPLRDAHNNIVSALSITRDITEQKNSELEREAALTRIKKLEGIIPICMHCKKIRDDKNSWNQLEQYISAHSEAVFSHGICPQCAEQHYKDILATRHDHANKG